MGRVIAIDGPSGAGKSTIAKLLAQRLGFTYLDTGALYRAVALGLLERGTGADDDDERIRTTLEMISIRFADGRVFLDGRDVSERIRTPAIGHYSSVFSARGVVRNFLLAMQRNVAALGDVVAEGRDTGTVVFPEAWRKFYLDASPAERTRRRLRQLTDLGQEITEQDAERDISDRDMRDSRREIAPLAKAEGAVVIDTTDRGIEQVLEELLAALKGNR